MVGLHRYLYSKITVPHVSVGNDAFMYFKNRTVGGRFVYAPEALTAFKMPQTLKDYIKQQRRFSATVGEQGKAFGLNVAAEYRIPLSLKLKAVTKAAIRHNIYLVAYVVYQGIARLQRNKQSASWEVSSTTKKV
jgi:hypothetical protein